MMLFWVIALAYMPDWVLLGALLLINVPQKVVLWVLVSNVAKTIVGVRVLLAYDRLKRSLINPQREL